MAAQTLAQMFLEATEQFPREDCFSYRGSDGKYVHVSSVEARHRVRALRHGLKSLGVAPGDRVAILSENRLEWVLSDLGALCAGAVTVPIYPTLLPATIEYILADCQPVVVFVSTEEQAAKIHEIRDRLPSLRDVVAFERTMLPEIMPFDKLLQIGGNHAADLPEPPGGDYVPTDKDAPCSIIYTSGTTGDPKGVTLSHWNFVSNVLAIGQLFHFSTADKVLSFLPLSHVLERMAGYYTMVHNGVGIAFAERMETVPQDIIEVGPTIIISVPRLYEKIYGKTITTAKSGGFVKQNIFFWAREVGMRCARRRVEGKPVGAWLGFQHKVADTLVFSKLRAKLGGNIRFMVSGGAPLNARINQFFYGAGLYIMEGYGLTETSPVLTCNSDSGYRFGSVGKPIPDTEIRIADDGEILARGPQVMPGYYKNEAATTEMIDAEGWLATGDIGHIDEDGFVFITDRKKDVIVTAGGKNIAPQPIENQFRSNKYVSQIVVVGDRRQYLSALIVPDFETLRGFAGEQGIDQSLSDAELVEQPRVQELFNDLLIRSNHELPGFSQIKKCALLAREFTLEAGELTPTMKVKRFAIATKYRDVIASMYPAGLPGEED